MMPNPSTLAWAEFCCLPVNDDCHECGHSLLCASCCTNQVVAQEEDMDEAEKKARELYTQWEEGDHSTEGLITAVAAALRDNAKDNYEEAEHYRIEASDAYLANEELQDEIARLNARQALEQARKEQREKDAEIITAMPDQPGYSYGDALRDAHDAILSQDK